MHVLCYDDYCGDPLMYLLISLIISSICTFAAGGVCSNQVCEKIEEHLAWSGFSLQKKCQSTYNAFCARTPEGTLTAKMNDRVDEERENLLTNATIQPWLKHKSKAIRMVAQQFISCIRDQKGKATMKDQLIEYLKHLTQLQTQYVHQDNIVYSRPVRREKDVGAAIRNMNNVTLCATDVTRKYPRVVERMYIDHRLGNVSIIDSTNYIRKYYKWFLQALRVQGKPIIKCDDCLDKLESLQLKVGYDETLKNDALLDAMYSPAVDLATKRLEAPPQPVWVLPLYPDATWYNLGENVLCE